MSSWRGNDIDWRSGDVVSAGVDVGSVSSQAVVMVDGRLYAWSSMGTGSSSADSARECMGHALEGTDLKVDDIHFVVGTGYGRANVPFAHKRTSEIHCHARGGNFIYGDRVRTILDVGGQDCKVICCDARGKVGSFRLSDKCAAGTGRGVETFADLLQVPLSEVGPMSLDVEEEPAPVASKCVVYARSEALGLLGQGWSKEQVMASYCRAMSDQIFAMLEQVGVERELGITGGIAKNPGVVTRLERALGYESLKSEIDPQIAGALGAALFAQALEEKKRKKEARGQAGANL